MKPAALLVPGLALGAWLPGALLLAGMHWALVAGWWLAGAALGAWALAKLHAAWARPAARMADATRAIAGSEDAPDLAPAGPAPLRGWAEAVNALAGRRRELGTTMAAQVEEASARVAQQRDQLAALMAQLQHSVVVCNAEGRILLYNERALRLSRELSQAPGAVRGAELVGLGRSIHALVEPGTLAHALDVAEARRARGDLSASARFVTTTADGQLLRVSLAPVHRQGDGNGVLTGFVLMLDDITREQEVQARRDRVLRELTEASRASFAAIQAALDMIEYPDLEPAERDRFQAVVRQEVTQMAARLERLTAEASADQRVRWPLQRMLGADLLGAAGRRILAESGQEVAVEVEDGGLWLRVDSLGLIQALAFLVSRLLGAGAQVPRLRLAPAAGRAHLDLAWQGADIDVDTLRGWQAEPMQARGALTVRDVVERHGGELWLERDAAGERAYYRFLMPVARAGQSPGAVEGRPEYYDFDLFAASAGQHGLDERPLSALSFTVFDTETTGLDPAGGDEIIQIGAVRIVNGKLLASERFDQLVNPRRVIPEAGIRIHGIDQGMVRGQPAIAEVLPAFHAFVEDTVLVGHNVAFDMRFLALKEEACGVRFDQPVLDTLLLGSLAWPNEPSHGLDELAARLGITIADRHTALGDARATAEVFLRLVPLLRERGIATLGEARAASRASYYAALRY